MQGKSEDVTLKEFRPIHSQLQGLDQPHAGKLPAQMLRSRHLRRLGASAQFRQDLVRDFEKTAAKKFRYDAEVDAPNGT